MKLSRFVNNLDSAPLHSSGLAGEGAPKPQSFSERKQLEGNRRIIRGYQESLLGAVRLERGQVRPPQRPKGNTLQATPSRQQFNAGSTLAPSFREPPARGYNPYS